MANDVFGKLSRELQGDVDRAVKTALESVVAEAKARCLEDESPPHVRDHIHVETEPEGLYLVAGTPAVWWAHLIEFGSEVRATRNRPTRKGHTTGRMPAHPFLYPAFEANRENIMKAAEAAVREACNG